MESKVVFFSWLIWNGCFLMGRAEGDHYGSLAYGNETFAIFFLKTYPWKKTFCGQIPE